MFLIQPVKQLFGARQVRQHSRFLSSSCQSVQSSTTPVPDRAGGRYRIPRCDLLPSASLVRRLPASIRWRAVRSLLSDVFLVAVRPHRFSFRRRAILVRVLCRQLAFTSSSPPVRRRPGSVDYPGGSSRPGRQPPSSDRPAPRLAYRYLPYTGPRRAFGGPCRSAWRDQPPPSRGCRLALRLVTLRFRRRCVVRVTVRRRQPALQELN